MGARSSQPADSKQGRGRQHRSRGDYERCRLVDIRPLEQRIVEGEVPGAILIGRNVLEWRLDPASEARIPALARADSRIIVMCSEGYASTLAATSLRRIGLAEATDLEGGFQAWKAAGLPTRPAQSLA